MNQHFQQASFTGRLPMSSSFQQSEMVQMLFYTISSYKMRTNSNYWVQNYDVVKVICLGACVINRKLVPK